MASPEVVEDVDEEECVILIHDDQIKNSLENSVVQVDCSEEFPSSEKKAEEMVDEGCELIVTFCKRAKLMPHARYDCMMYPFVRAECETSSPLGGNAETCSECYCYICNTLAVECKDWVAPSLCHCNAHNKSQYWKDQWNFALTGGLSMFSLELSEIDADVRRGGELLQKFMHDITVEYNQYLMGERIFSDCHECFCHRNLGPGQCDFCGLHSPVIYRYTSVSDLVTGFLNQAAKEKPQTEAIALLGAAREIMLHKDPASYSQNVDHSASLSKAVMCLMERITRQLQRLLILNDFPKPLHEKLTHFYRSIPFPVHCYEFTESLDFVPWDHGFLISVLKGQNISGRRLQNGKKETLLELFPVIEARVERMEANGQYKELIRYLRVVRCYDFQGMKELKDKMPFYVCKIGDLERAARMLFTSYRSSCCTACRLSPFQFEVYLKIFHTGQVPSGRDLKDCTQWSPVGAPLKLHMLIKWMVKVLYRSTTLYKNLKCWSSLIRTISSCPVLAANTRLITVKEPPLDFQQMVFAKSCRALEDITTNLRQNIFPSQVLGNSPSFEKYSAAGLIFAVQAARQMILKEYHSLNSFLEVILAFGCNFWALKLLLGSLAQHEKALSTIVALTVDDLQCRQAEMLKLWQRCGPQYVGQLLCLFLTSRDKNVPSVGLSIIRIMQANLQQCPWAKQVGQFLGNPKNLPCYPPTSEVSSFIEVTQTLP